MYSLKEERISKITPFSVFADNKRIRNKIIEGKSTQETRSGKNLYSSVLNSSSNVTTNNSDLIIDFSKDIDAYARLTFKKEVGKTYTFVFDGSGMADGESVTFYLENSDQIFNFKNGKNVWVQSAIKENSYFGLDDRDRSNISSTITISNIMILEGEYTEETIPEYETYGASPSSEFPSEIHSLGDDVNLWNLPYIYELSKHQEFIQDIPAGTYTLNAEDIISDYSNRWTVLIIFYYEDGTSKNIYIGGTQLKTHTITLEKDVTRFIIYSNNTWATSQETTTIFKGLKFQKGEIATSYSEYGKGAIGIKRTGVNELKIIDDLKTYLPLKVNDLTMSLNENGIFKVTGNNTTTGFTSFEFNTERTILKKGISYVSQMTMSLYKVRDNSWVGNKKTITPDEDMYFNHCYWTTDIQGEINETVLPMLVQGSVLPKTYEPYKGNNYVIPISQPLRSLPNGVKDTIEEDGIHRRVGLYSVSIDHIVTLSNGNVGGVVYPPKKTPTYTSSTTGFMCTKAIAAKTFQENTAYENPANIVIVGNSTDTLETLKEKFDGAELLYELAEEVIEPFDEEQQAVINSMETFEGINHFSLVGDLETTLTFDYNPQITEEIKRAFKYNITKAYLEVAATDKASGFQINEDNYLQSIDFDDCRYIEGEGVIGSCVAKELQGKFVNVDTSFDIENREIECFIGAETEDNITHYLRLGTFIVQKPENDNVKDNTSFDSLDYMIKFNKEYVHRMAKYLKTEDTDIYPEKQYYILNDSGVYEEVIVPHKEEIGNYYEVIDEYTLMQLLKDICEQCEVKLGTFNFRNADYLVHGNRFDSGVSCRDVLKAIAQAAFSWARINEYNELLLDFETSDTITEEIDYNEYYDLSFNDKYGPVNTIVLKNSQAEGENITIKNDDLINSPIGKNLFTNLKWQEQTYAYFGIDDEIYTLSLKLKEGQTIPSDLYFGFSKKGYYDSSQKIKWIITRGSLTAGVITDDGTGYLNNVTGNEILNYVSVFPTNYKDTLTDYFDIQLEKGSAFSGYEEPILLGPKELAISDNPFAYSEETRKAIIQAGEAIYGFKYVPLSVETIGAAYLNCKDKLKIKNMQDGDLETYVFDTRISYQGTIKSNIETLAMTDTETKYRYDGSLTTAQRRTEFRVDKAEQKITSLVKATTEQGEKLTEAVQDLDGFKRTITDKTDETAEKVTTIEEKVDGLITSKSVSGGQNLIKNSVGYFGNDYWQINAETEGTVLSENSTDVKQNSISGSALKLQAETIYQDIKEIKNGEYYLSFNYKKIIDTAIATLKVNDLVIDLTQENWTEETHLINVTSNNIKIEMTTDLNSSILITDLMLTEGNLQVSWTQNANESYTDTVQIGKGVRITATGSDTEFVAEASGITINNIETNNPVAEFTKYGTETQELVAHKDVKVADSLLIQKIGNQTWFSSL